jgi:uncharacterized protein YbaR (Trm112 family)
MTEHSRDTAHSPLETNTADLLMDEMLQLLVCPVDHARLDLNGDGLVCQACGRRYPIEDGVPNMLIEEL